MLIKFGFSCNCLESILKNGVKDMLDELYKAKGLSFLKTRVTQTRKSLSPLMLVALKKPELKNIWALRKPMLSGPRTKRSGSREMSHVTILLLNIPDSSEISFFMSAPIRLVKRWKRSLKAMVISRLVKSITGKTKDSGFSEIYGSKKDVSVTFEVNFEASTDQALARIFLMELQDSKR